MNIILSLSGFLTGKFIIGFPLISLVNIGFKRHRLWLSMRLYMALRRLPRAGKYLKLITTSGRVRVVTLRPVVTAT